MTRWLPGPSLDRNPVLWHKFNVVQTFAVDDSHPGSPHGDDRSPLHRRSRRVLDERDVTIGPGATSGAVAGVFSYILHLIFGLLMLSAIAPTWMTQERQRGSLDILAATASPRGRS